MNAQIVLSSPYARALATARIAIDELGGEFDLHECNALTPDSSPEEAWADVRVHRDAAGILLVGHEPLFSALTAYLAGCPDLAIEFGTGTLACVEVRQFGAQPGGVLRWVLPAGLAAD